MKTKHRYPTRAFALASMLSLWLFPSSCEPQESPAVREPVTFSVTASDSPATKAAGFYSSENLPVSIALVSYTYGTSGAESSAWSRYPSGGSVIEARLDGRASGTTSGKWVPVQGSGGHVLLWPGPEEGKEFIRFFAYAPHGAAGVTVADPSAGAGPSISYTVPSAVSGQLDLLVSDAASCREYAGDPSWRKIDIPMNLVHALTAVRFRIIDGLSIESVSVGGVKDAGSLDLSNTAGWTNLSGSATYTLTNLSLGTGSGSGLKEELPGYNVVEDNYILLLLPQSPLPEGATVTAVVSDGTNDRTITASLAGQEYWKPGTMVTYTITRTNTTNPANPDLAILVNVDDFDDAGSDIVANPVTVLATTQIGAGILDDIMVLEIVDPYDIGYWSGTSTTGTVISYRKDISGENKPVPWFIEGLYATALDAVMGTNKLSSSTFVTDYAPETTALGSVDAGERVRIDYNQFAEGIPYEQWLRIEQTGGAVSAMRVIRSNMALDAITQSGSYNASFVNGSTYSIL